jgi:hypothetical protein
MSLKNNMSDVEKSKISKTKPLYEETYKKGVLGENKQIIDILQRDGSFIEVQKHANLGNDINSATIKIFFNAE